MNSEFRFAQSGTCVCWERKWRGDLSGWVSFLVLQLVRHDCPKEQSPDREKKAQVLGYALTKPALQSGTTSCHRGENQRLRGPTTCLRSHKDYKKSAWCSMLGLWIPDHESLISLTQLPGEMQAVGGPLEGECDIKPGFIV